ncbi:MAG: metallophosphoesterase [candidate division WOR-3 bacterium]|nr:MAG: metallophosphoesterase [candidate division WOR-3 bacterium]
MKKFILVILCGLFFLSAKTENSFRFVVVGDRTGTPQDPVFEEIMEEIALLDPDFVMCVGDIAEVDVGDSLAVDAAFDHMLEIVGKLPCKFYWCAGNNDIGQESDRALYQAKTGFKRYYSFNHENSHFVVLDNTMLYFAQTQDMDEEQLDWLQNDLEKHKQMDNTFVFYHIPTYIYARRQGETDTLMQLFEKYGVDAVFTGHHHEYSYLKHNNVEYINVGSSGGGISTHDPARGHFYQYLTATIRGDNRSIALFKKGSAMPRDQVTLEDHETIDRLNEEAIVISEFIIEDDAENISQSVTATVENSGVSPLVNPIIWDTDQARYTIDPGRMNLDVATGEKKEYTFDVTLTDGSDPFPIPRFTIAYPFAENKVCTLYYLLSVRRQKNVAEASTPPEIDGQLDDPLWQAVAPVTALGNYDGSEIAPIEKTELYFAHDDENLYFAARCYDSDLPQLRAEVFEHDGTTYYDDNLWLFFDTNDDQETYFQAIINCNGAVFDRKCATDGTRDVSWNGAWEVISGREAGAWTLEFKIAKAELTPFSEEKWGFNMRRLQPRLHDAGYWSIPFAHAPQYFGILVLK